jgi:hypothetical protein
MFSAISPHDRHTLSNGASILLEGAGPPGRILQIFRQALCFGVRGSPLTIAGGRVQFFIFKNDCFKGTRWGGGYLKNNNPRVPDPNFKPNRQY